LLKEVARRLQSKVRSVDTVARLGGDEFAVILPSVVDPAEATLVAKRLAAALEAPIAVEQQTVSTAASVGVAMFPEHGREPETLLRRADVAMYLAKRGRSGVNVYSPEQDSNSPLKLAFANELGRAITRDELTLHYQPKVSMRTNEVVGVEALVRWPHREQGLVGPDQFVPLAEETGLMREMTYRVLEAAGRQYARWRREGIVLPIAVNVSPTSLVQDELVDRVAELVQEWDFTPGDLTIEITEGALIADLSAAAEVMKRLQMVGVRFSIDDFGTGYSSLSYLQELPADEIKIDRGFVRALGASQSAGTVVEATINIGRQTGMTVVAEGLEDRRAWRILRGMGCDVGQGFYFCAPLPPDELMRWYAATTRPMEPKLVEAG
jgi:predicted signal transduction protein with EAL and GGDEF domain